MTLELLGSIGRALTATSWVLAYQAVLGGHPEAMAMIPELVGSFTALFGIPGAILGIASWHRGVMQVQQVKASASADSK